EPICVTVADDHVGELGLHHRLFPSDLRLEAPIGRSCKFRQAGSLAVALADKDAVIVERDRLRTGGTPVRLSRLFELPELLAIASAVSPHTAFVDMNHLFDATNLGGDGRGITSGLDTRFPASLPRLEIERHERPLFL